MTKWYKSSGEAWYAEHNSPFYTHTVHETDRERVVIYDAQGQSLSRPKQSIGFQLPHHREAK